MAFKCNSKFTETLRFLKLALFPLILLPTAIFALRVLIPLAADVAATTLTSHKNYLAPPYLFVTINFIILTIWKLSEKGHTQSDEHISHKPKQVVVSFPPTKQDRPTWGRQPPPPTEDPDPIPVAPPESPLVPVTPKIEDEEKESGQHEVEDEEEVEEVEEEEEELSIDDTWMKITGSMKKSETFTERRRKVETVYFKKCETFRERRNGVPANRAELLMDLDDLNRRYEALARRMKHEPPPPLPKSRELRH